MAKENWLPSDTITLPSSGDMSALQFYFVAVTSSGNIIAIEAATNHAIGILLNDPDAAGEAANVMTSPGKIVKMVSDGTTDIAIGDYVGPDADGKAIKKTANEYHGVALEASTGADDGALIGVLYTGKREF